MTRLIKARLGFGVVLGVVVLGGTGLGGTASASGTSGPIKVWGIVNGSTTNRPTPVLVTGAIGDVGTEQTVNSSGRPDGKGNYFKLSLRKGSLTLNGTQFNGALSAEENGNPPADYSVTTCTGSFTVGPAPAPVVSGTGAYAGISGSVNLSAQLAILLGKTKAGACNTGANATSLGFWGVVTGQGTISY